MSDILKTAAELGGFTGFLTIFIVFIVLLFYRQDRKTSEDRLREDRKLMEDRLDKIVNAYNATVEGNTKALTELVTLVQRLNGH